MDLREQAVWIVEALLDEKIDPAELRKGTKDEQEEHDMPPATARKTALQHLTRVYPKYYTVTDRAIKKAKATRPKGYMIGDTTTIGMAAGGA